LNKRLNNISGVVYINNQNSGLSKSVGGVFMRYGKKNEVNASNKVVVDLSDLTSQYKPIRKEYLNVIDYITDTVTLETNGSSFIDVILKFEDKYQNPALFISINIKIGTSITTSATSDILGNVMLKNVSSTDSIEVTTNDNRF
jgi:hypothetical protein